MRTPQQARSRRTRARVLEAAVEVFEECGYDDATTAAIAHRAQVSVGSVYGYFRDKRAILLEIIQETFARSEMEIIEALAPELWLDGNMHEKVRALVDTAIRARRLRPGIGRIVWERFFRDPLVKEAVEQSKRSKAGPWRPSRYCCLRPQNAGSHAYATSLPPPS
ncbi:MAG: TetR/AcrR family transcriptional regulator [Deltaproteobacteria bacterium]|nr:TetR/AcrR family transcriptional regulator [Deltaproteobacteria bacterium]